MHIHSLNIGQPQQMEHGDKSYRTAINRTPTDQPVMLHRDGLVGDQVGNRRVHGGAEMAVCVFPFEHYEYYTEKLQVVLEVPAFGENLTTAGLLEDECCVGDIFEIGNSRVEISKPREPCNTLARKHDEPRIVKWVWQMQYCGFYLRVLQPGQVQVGDKITLIDRPHPALTVARVLSARGEKETSTAFLRELAECASLSPPWRRKFAKRLESA